MKNLLLLPQHPILETLIIYSVSLGLCVYNSICACIIFRLVFLSCKMPHDSQIISCLITHSIFTLMYHPYNITLLYTSYSCDLLTRESLICLDDPLHEASKLLNVTSLVNITITTPTPTYELSLLHVSYPIPYQGLYILYHKILYIYIHI